MTATMVLWNSGFGSNETECALSPAPEDHCLMDAKSSVFQSYLMLVGCARLQVGLQVEVAGCSFVCSQCWFAVPDRRNQSRSKNSMIAGRGHFDCRSLHLGRRCKNSQLSPPLAH
ncbi:hypothetical protein CFBP3840_P100104 (plasmid) [Pseudomonas syringae]|uniref:Uncharacterized protein n=1 Tax=Pseudomonas syringae TaxID=317 RepID=A0A2K4X3C7_PSESX|nr:hypothetical protein CFBP3840_P100104 [Pseudomonas syringae]